jgi:AcrR family transcriptional regulator
MPSSTKKKTDSTRSPRLGRSDWIDAALRALSVGGLGNLSVERLAGDLGATKGSFYWHFKDRSALVEAALAEWERRDTDQLIERASIIDDPRERLKWLFHVVFADEAAVGIDTALLADAEDPIVSAALERIAAKRLRFIESQFKEMGAKASSDRALLTYTAFVGLGQLRRATPSLTPTGRRSSRYVSNVSEWLID